MEGESPTLIIVNSIIIFNIIITIIIVYTPPVIPPVFAQMTHLENHSESIQKKLQQNWPVLCLYDCRCNIKFEISPFFPLDKKSWMFRFRLRHQTSDAQSIKCQCCTHMETSQLICCANQLTGFYMRATLALNGLNIP